MNFQSGRCVAGKIVADGAYGEWIRPVSARPSAEISFDERQYEDGKEPEIFDILDIPMIAHAPRVHQTENHMIECGFLLVQTGLVGLGPFGDPRRATGRFFQ